MKKLLLIITLFVSINFISITAPLPVYAEVASGCDGSESFLSFPTWYKYLDIGGPNCDIIGPTAEDSTPENIKIDWEAAAGRIGLAVLEILLRIVGLVAVGFVIYGGFRYITSQGDPESAKSARQTIINGVIGLVISLIATGLVRFIATSLTNVN